MSKRDRRARKKERRAQFIGDSDWAHVSREDLEMTVQSLWILLGQRNIVLAELRQHLTDRHKQILAWPGEAK